VDDNTFQQMLDRLAASADFSSVREGILVFLQTHLHSFPDKLPKEDAKLLEKRKKKTIKTMESMSVLEMVGAEAETNKDWDADAFGEDEDEDEDEA
jgi:hypothetical protein